ncbi:MAG: CvpA family protein [Pseudomonadota bacterium]|uniref:Colicin V production protein n=1 Tax=Thalassovita autumnalis TaxID=2072972 RepID=A0A0P1F7L7_9RHOB|nr:MULTISPECIES: CvpA family protein [Thalassovita]MEC7962637.1 CvpA family protein [Pseudomonadota bacterium]MEC8042614.1 CvpA family protein [Pseudomonadota bacterium]MEC8293003.1 CvpA family protein [Pseudomonadota bacterium]CUH64053.1 colicin V production protein [Thalassovita autumnalis]CUH72806.1 colicin V production protein [Thalassovita autumnalis]
MDGFTIIDGVVALVIILSALLAYSRGLVRESLAIAGWILAAVLAFMFAPKVQPLVKEIPVVGDFIADSCELSMLSAAFVVAALVLVVASLFTPLFSSLVQRSILGGLDQGLGFLFGVLRGVLLVAITFFVYETVAVGQDVAMVDNSRSAKVFASMTGKIEDRDPSASLGWITSKYEDLVSSCEL